MTGIRCVSGKMDPTRTFCTRWWRWIDTPGLSCDGIMILGQIAEKRGDVDEQTYAVEEVRCTFPGGRSFAVRKLGAELGGDDEMYTTTVLPRNSVCTCKAGKTHTEICRHRSGLSAAIQAGAIPAKQSIGA